MEKRKQEIEDQLPLRPRDILKFPPPLLEPYKRWDPSMESEQWRKKHLMSAEEALHRHLMVRALSKVDDGPTRPDVHWCDDPKKCGEDHEEIEELRPLRENWANFAAETQNPRMEVYRGWSCRSDVFRILNVDEAGFNELKVAAYHVLNDVGYINQVFEGPANIQSYKALFTGGVRLALGNWIVQNVNGNQLLQVRKGLQKQVLDYVRVYALNAVFRGEIPGQGNDESAAETDASMIDSSMVTETEGEDTTME